MGGSASKPVVLESARSVIARRKKELAPIVSEIVTDVSSATSSEVVTLQQPKSAAIIENFTPEAMNTMGNWGDYIHATSYKNPKAHGAKIEMASTVRHAEDKLKINAKEGIAGRLSEGQVLQIFSDLRHTERPYKEIAHQYLLDVSDIRRMSRFAKLPVIYNDKETAELTAR